MSFPHIFWPTKLIINTSSCSFPIFGSRNKSQMDPKMKSHLQAKLSVMEPVDDLESRQQALEPIQTKRSAAREVEGNGEKPEDIEELLLEEEEALSPVARIFHEPCLNVYVLAISGFKTRIDVDVVKANLGHTLLKHPRFSSLQVD
uniref:Uncharacterized protein n=1 Tax=Vitis vinifera TaxID=29760 RepID=F6I6E0_VITVI